MTEQCGSCKWFESKAEEVGICHRYPPTVYPNGQGSMSLFPPVQPTEFCGEYSRVLVITPHGSTKQ